MRGNCMLLLQTNVHFAACLDGHLLLGRGAAVVAAHEKLDPKWVFVLLVYRVL